MLADDDNMADVWYNIGQVAIGVGDLGGASRHHCTVRRMMLKARLIVKD